MKFLHTSDWHLGMSLRGVISYLEDQKFMIDEICEIATHEGVDGIFVSGDIFDKSVANSAAIQLYDDTMTRLCVDMGIPVYIIAGNHDGAERLSMCNKLLSKSGLHILGSLEKEPVYFNRGDVDIYMLPWISTEKVRSVYPDEAENTLTLEDAYRVVLNGYHKTFDNSHKQILLAHAFITDADRSTSDRSAEIGHATMVPASLFEMFSYVALGHLHGPQQITERIRYSGTPMAYSFGKEEHQQKSVTIVDTDNMQQTIIPLKSLHKRTTLTGTFEELLKADFDEDVVNGYVRLEVTDCFVGMQAMADLRQKYPNLLEVSSKSFERDDARITMTVEEFEECSKNPEEIFKRYCEDILEDKPSEHLSKLFEEAVQKYEKEALNNETD